MASSLVYWTQDLFFEKLLAPRRPRLRDDLRPATTSCGCVRRRLRGQGRARVLRAQIAVELAPHGITANALRAGVTGHSALRKIPGNEAMIERVSAMHPAARLTTPADVAKALVSLWAGEGGAWVSGNVIGVDGAEDVAGGR
jgi:hypothetical protein